MKKPLLLLLISLSFGSQAYADCYETRLTGVEAFQGRTGEIVKTLEGTIWEVRYDAKSLNAYGSEILVCNGRDNSGEAYLIVKGYKIKVKRVGHVNGNSNRGNAGAEAAYQSGALLAKGLIGILEAVVDLSVKNKTQSTSNSSSNPMMVTMPGKRFYEKGTNWKWKGNYGYGDDGMKCRIQNEYYFLSCNNGVSYYDCDEGNILKTCGNDGTSYKSSWKDSSDDMYYCLTSNFGSKCCGNKVTKVCR